MCNLKQRNINNGSLTWRKNNAKKMMPSKSTKVCHITMGYYPGTLGGIQSFIHDLHNDLLKAQIKSEVISLGLRSKKARMLKMFRIPVFGIHPYLLMLSFLTAFIYSIRHRKEIRLIHAHDMLFGGLTGVFIKLISRRPLIITDHGIESVAAIYIYNKKHGDTWLSQLNKIFLLSLEKFVTTHANRIMCVNEYSYDYFVKRKVNHKKIKIVRNGIDVKKFKPKQPAFSKNDITILYAGRISTEKGVIALIKVFSLLERNHQNLKLLIVGEGPEKATVEKMVRLNDKISLLPSISRDDMTDLYNNSDIVMIPSILETGTPLTLLEAMACERTVVVNSAGSLPYVVNNAALIAPFNDPLKASTLIKKMLDDREKAVKLARLARETVVKNFNWQNCFKEIIRNYMSVCR